MLKLYLATLWLTPDINMLDGAILPSRIIALKDQQTACGWMRREAAAVPLSCETSVPDFLIGSLSIYIRLDVRRPLPKIDLVTFLDAEVFRMIFHFPSLSAAHPGYASVRFWVSLFRFTRPAQDEVHTVVCFR